MYMYSRATDLQQEFTMLAMLEATCVFVLDGGTTLTSLGLGQD